MRCVFYPPIRLSRLTGTVADFVEFLAQKYSHPPQQKSGHLLRLHKDIDWMIEDFNAPLAD